MIKQNILKPYFFIYILTVVSLSMHAQDAVNQFDSSGQRHGVWRKYYHNTDQLRYEGQFDHGKEIGEFKFYTLNKGESVLSAVKQFNSENDLASVKFLSSTGKMISEGQMNGKLYIGKWIYYHNKSDGILSVEYYNDRGISQRLARFRLCASCPCQHRYMLTDHQSLHGSELQRQSCQPHQTAHK